ncbi:4'-phosphopantetheinyl transferase family protein [Hyphomonas chukchiensis]|uniref:4'-phosphopantetheinyl transferase family protein n=1 Tax=Hyphomonas chukchiensis TaxID=1280947 RepID=UPI0030FBF510
METDANTGLSPRFPAFVTVAAPLKAIEATLCDSATWAAAGGDAIPPMREYEGARVAKLVDAGAARRLRDSLVCTRVMIAERLGISADDVRLTRSDEGASHLENAPERSVSISRSGGWTLLALGDGSAIGADVEVMRPLDWRAMLGMVCSEPEAAAFTALAENEPEQTLRAFFTLWTIKEAVLKATGRGLRGGAKTVAVPVEGLAGDAQPLREISVSGVTYSVWSGWEGDVALSVASAFD